MRKLRRLLIMALAASALAGASPAAGLLSSPLPGFPRFRGVMLVHDGSAATSARERAISSALKTAASSTNPNCKEANVNPGADLCYWGGPVVGAHTVHLIFWEGPGATHTFPAKYVETIEAYFANVAAASKTATEANSSAYSVATQYAGSNGPVDYSVSFSPATDVLVDTANPIPSAGPLPTQCQDGSFSTCITDEKLREEVTTARALKGWGASLQEIYLIFTPPNVGSCFGPGSSAEGNVCALVAGGYCAYHGSFENLSKQPVAPLYANLPDSGEVQGCDYGEHPNGANGVDATLDATSHEHNETITDPLGNGWYDAVGQEIADKCLPPETFDIFGGPLGGSSGTLYNQSIGGGHYWLQTEWSNSAGEYQGGCVQRVVHSEFTPPAGARAAVPTVFDGSASGEGASDPIVYWQWDFGDERNGGEFLTVTASPTVAHSYALPGRYTVTLTAIDAYGNSNTHAAEIEVGSAPPAKETTVPPPTIITNTVTVPTPIVPTRYSAGQIAAKLGLPASGATLSASGVIALGKAHCPPACSVTLRLYATAPGRHHRRLLIGRLTMVIAANGTGTLALRCNATGRRLLRRSRRIHAQLSVTVTGQEGGAWQLSRSLLLRR